MFLEVYPKGDPSVGSRGSVFRSYTTKLSHVLDKNASIGLSLGEFAKNVPRGNLGGLIEFEEKTGEDIIHIHRMYPLGFDLLRREGQEAGKTKLSGKGINGAVEYLFLSQFSTNFSVSHDRSMTQSRRGQLRSYGVLGKYHVGAYLQAFHRSLYSPHFRIVKFPSWITDEQKTEFLQLGEKT